MMEGKTRGMLLLTYLMQIEKHWGKDELEEVLQLIGIDKLRSVKGMNWYDVEQLHLVLHWIAVNKGPEFIRDRGMESTQEISGLMKLLVKLFVKEEKMFRQFGESYKEFFDFGRVESFVKGRSAIVRFHDCAYDDYICLHWFGAMNGVILLKKSNGMAWEFQCQRKGAPYCEFQAHWGPDAEMRAPPPL